MIKVIVFDLDGTLSDTKDLELSQPGSSGYRLPFDILRKYPPFTDTNDLWLLPKLKDHIKILIDCGIKIHIITRSPQEYASTVAFLLRIDFHELHSSSQESITQKLEKIKSTYNLQSFEMLYVGDTYDDRVSANGICLYQAIESLRIPSSLASNYFYELLTLCRATKNYVESMSTELSDASYVNWRRADRDRFYKFLDLNASNNNVEQYESYLHKWDIQKNQIRPVLDPSLCTNLGFESVQGALESIEILFYKYLGIKKTRIFINTAQNDSNFLNDFPIFSYSKYRQKNSLNCSGDQLWFLIKNWQGKDLGSSKKINLSFLIFVAQAMACGLRNEEKTTLLVPIPSHDFSEEKPAQTSVRLAELIGEILGLGVLNLLTQQIVAEDNSREFRLNGQLPRANRVILIDDQITKGETASKIFKLFRKANYSNLELHAFTHSDSRWNFAE